MSRVEWPLVGVHRPDGAPCGCPSSQRQPRLASPATSTYVSGAAKSPHPLWRTRAHICTSLSWCHHHSPQNGASTGSTHHEKRRSKPPRCNGRVPRPATLSRFQSPGGSPAGSGVSCGKTGGGAPSICVALYALVKFPRYPHHCCFSTVQRLYHRNQGLSTQLSRKSRARFIAATADLSASLSPVYPPQAD